MPRKKKLAKWFLLLIASVLPAIGVAIDLCYKTPLSYVYCLLREDSWLAAKTEAELDSRMWSFCTKQSITPSNSSWGWDYEIQPDERMVQYLIFGKEPLDVVFDRESRIVRVFTSYE